MDEMTPMERVAAAMSLRQPDRVPVVLHSMTWAVKYSGYKFSECLADADKFVDAQARAREDLGYDSVCGLGAIFEISEAYGSLLTVFEDETPGIVEYVLSSAEDFEKLDPTLDITKAGWIPLLLEVIEKLKKRVGPDVPVMAVTRAPFVTAATMRGVESIYMDLILDPAFVHKLVDFCVEPCTAFAEAAVDAGADIVWIGDSAATGPGVSPQHYQEFGLPYARWALPTARARYRLKFSTLEPETTEVARRSTKRHERTLASTEGGRHERIRRSAFLSARPGGIAPLFHGEAPQAGLEADDR
jgi:MtaA/CmuA family methyltransferase